MSVITRSPQERIPLSQPSITDMDREAVMDVLSTTTLSLGPRARQFEQAVADYVGAVHGIAVNSGTSGLHLCVAAEGIGPGDEVVTTPFSFVASSNCALYQGATPVFVDIEPDTLGLDTNKVEARISDQTKAIIPVDVFGQPARLEELADIANRHELVLVEDACEAIGAERFGRRIGVHGKAAVFAFYPNKQLTTGEGGVVVTNDGEFAAIVRSMTNQGRDDAGTWMNHVRLGYNYRLDEMSAALGLSQMSRIDDILSRRAQVAAWYEERLRLMQGASPPIVVPETTRMSWFVFVIQLCDDVDRPALMEQLEGDGIPSRPYFVPIHLQPLYRERFGYSPGDFPVTERIAARTLAIPFFTDMTEEQVDYVCERLKIHLAGARIVD